jgi:hypothetical protein
MKVRLWSVVIVSLVVISAASADDDQSGNIPLTVPPGAPLRLYLTKKVSKRAGEPVEAKLLEPVYAFDREVIPSGTEIRGRVSRIEALSKWQRAQALLGGDFTPLHRAQVEFTTLAMPDGREIPLHTMETVGLNSIYSPAPQKPSQGKNGGVLGIGKQTARDQINAQIAARTRGIAGLVRGPNKKERLVDFAMAKLPYHPQWVRRGTRFDAELKDPLQFGSEEGANRALDLLGSQPPADSLAHARLLTPLDSLSATKGQTVEAMLVAPLFSPEHKLILPEGTRLSGSVVAARKARWFHRGGQLRFSFQKVDLPEDAARWIAGNSEPAPMRTQATLEAVEPGGKAPVKVDSEGGIQTTESKTRLLAPLISAMIASQSAHHEDHHATSRGNANVPGRTLGGGSGFGLLGAAAAQSSRSLGTALGFYGLAWSVYTNVVARGGEVQFDRNASINIRFSTRTPPGSKVHEAIASRRNRRQPPWGAFRACFDRPIGRRKGDYG